jgi:hypothetical protein
VSAELEHFSIGRESPGAKAEVLKIEGNWKDAMRKLISRKRPVGGWPKETS